MSSQVQLATVTAQFLKTPECAVVLPELQILKSSIENNSGHDHQTTFDHVTAVLRGMEALFQPDFLTAADQTSLTAYLNRKIGRHTRQDLLRLLVLLHDIAKPEATITNPDGTTSCPGHELLSAARVPAFQARFALEPVEVEWVQQLVRLHGDPHAILSLSLARPAEQTTILSTFAAAVGDGAIELTMMVYADLLGGDLETLNPPEFTARASLCQTWLTHLVRAST